MADAQDSKSCEGDFVWVQVPLSAGIKKAVMILVITAFLYNSLLINSSGVTAGIFDSL